MAVSAHHRRDLAVPPRRPGLGVLGGQRLEASTTGAGQGPLGGHRRAAGPPAPVGAFGMPAKAANLETGSPATSLGLRGP